MAVFYLVRHGKHDYSPVMDKVIVVTHGMVIHCLTGRIGIPNCSITEFEL